MSEMVMLDRQSGELAPVHEGVVAHPSQDLSLARDPEMVLAEAQRAAMALKHVIDNKTRPVRFNGETYLEYEDWQTLGRFYGITAKVVETRPVEFGEARGFEARAVALHLASGVEVSAADSMCLSDEATWKNKPLVQLRSMAQTRACGKALRNVLSWVVVLAGYRPTTAEEMDGVASVNASGNGKPVGCTCAGKKHFATNPKCGLNSRQPAGQEQRRQETPAAPRAQESAEAQRAPDAGEEVVYCERCAVEALPADYVRQCRATGAALLCDGCARDAKPAYEPGAEG